MARILVTGAAGFIGRALCSGLVARGHTVLGRTRGPAEPIPGVELRPIGDIDWRTDWSGQLDAIDVVVHLANRAHRWGGDPANDAEPAAAAALATAAADAGVRRMVFMSSVRAMGDATPAGIPFRGTDPPVPRDPYGRGKLAVESALQTTTQQSGLELVILRPPLVYGPAVKANFRALIRLAASGLPLPFAGIDNHRSLIYLDNLVDVAARACIVDRAAGCVLLARDTIDWSTPGLIRALTAGLGRTARLFTAPEIAFAALGALPGLRPLVRRLTLSLRVDDEATRILLDWRPPVPSETALAATARAFRARSWEKPWPFGQRPSDWR